MDVVEINKGREVLYNFLFKSLEDAPDKEYLKMFKDLSAYLSEMLDDENNDELTKAKEIFLNFKNMLGSESEEDELLLDLKKKYTRLFYLGGLSVPMYESVYLSPERILKQEPWEKVLKTFKENRFAPPKKGNYPEDHIAFELLFMSFLSDFAANYAENEDEANLYAIYQKQKEFLEDHLLKWVDLFSDRVLKIADQDSFYSGIVLLLKNYVKMDYEFLLSELE
jgi:TorA maturation chaperone TorD